MRSFRYVDDSLLLSHCEPINAEAQYAGRRYACISGISQLKLTDDGDLNDLLAVSRSLYTRA